MGISEAMSSKNINLYRPLLAESKQSQRIFRGAFGFLMLFIAINLGLKVYWDLEIRKSQGAFGQIQSLVLQEKEELEKLKLAAAVKPDEQKAMQLKKWRDQVDAKELFINHPEQFSSAQVKEWEALLTALETASKKEPEAWIQSFEAIGTEDGNTPKITIQGIALTKESALRFMETAASSPALAQKALGQTSLTPYTGAEGKGWQFSIKAGALK